MTVPPEPVVERVTLKEAIKLAHGKPERGFTRNDLLVYGGWLNSGWAWSRDVGVTLEEAMESSKRLGQQVKFVGKLPDKKKPSKGGFFGRKDRETPEPSDDDTESPGA